MAASVFCCLRCCRDGGTGHIPLKEMPAVQLDTQHMGKGPPFHRLKGPLGHCRRFGGRVGDYKQRSPAPRSAATPLFSHSYAALTAFGLVVLHTPAEATSAQFCVQGYAAPVIWRLVGGPTHFRWNFAGISSELPSPEALQRSQGVGRRKRSGVLPTVLYCRALIKTYIFSECFRSGLRSFCPGSQFSL